MPAVRHTHRTTRTHSPALSIKYPILRFCENNTTLKENHFTYCIERRMSSPSSSNSKKIEDCWGCRIVGGGTLIGVSMYLWRSQQRGSVMDRRVTSALAIAAFTCGALRLSLSQDQLHRIWNRKYWSMIGLHYLYIRSQTETSYEYCYERTGTDAPSLGVVFIIRIPSTTRKHNYFLEWFTPILRRLRHIYL